MREHLSVQREATQKAAAAEEKKRAEKREPNGAATKLQATWRGHWLRKDALMLYNDILHITATVAHPTKNIQRCCVKKTSTSRVGFPRDTPVPGIPVLTTGTNWHKLLEEYQFEAQYTSGKVAGGAKARNVLTKLSQGKITRWAEGLRLHPEYLRHDA